MGEKKKSFISVSERNDELSKNNVRRTPATPVPSQMSHRIDLGEPGSHLVHSLRSHTVQGGKDTFFHFQSANPSLLFSICRVAEECKRYESCSENPNTHAEHIK